MNQISRILYAAARTSRDINAIQRGPQAIARRAVRKATGRTLYSLITRILR